MSENIQENYTIPEGTFGGRVSTDIVNQINVRSRIRKKDNKTVKELSYTTSNAPWIMLRSGVNTVQDSVDTPSSVVAKNFILTGGTVAENSEGFKQFSGMEPFASNPMYMKTSAGFRPKPGITGIEVKTKDTWGCIMEATVHFTVWSLEDLENIDKLYFRPGMTALLEWGHSIYAENDGTVKTAEVGSIVIPNSIFFDKSCTFEEIDKCIQDNRKACFGNYEGLFGYITNFSYSFKKNGGYDCTLAVLSKGTVLEGLKVPYATGRYGGSGEMIKSEFHNILDAFKTNYRERSKKGKVDHMDNVVYPQTVVRWGKNTTLFYIRLDDLLRVISIITDPKYDGMAGVNTKTLFSQVKSYDPTYSRPAVLFKTGETYRKYVRFAEEVSINPYIAILPQSSDLNIQLSTGNSRFWVIKTIVPSVKSYSGNNVIGDILINFNYFVELVDDVVDSKADEFKVVAVIRTLLANVQKAFGNINEFKLNYNHVTDEWSIVDRSCINDVDPCPAITISGPGATVQNLNVKSEISPDIVNMMSIAATSPTPGKDGGKVEANASVVNWNEGSTNRHRVAKEDINNLNSEEQLEFTTNETSTKEEELIPLNIWYNRKSFESFMYDLEELYRKFSNTTGNRLWKQPGDASEAAYNELQLTAESLYSRYVNRDIGSRKTAGSLQTGIIPVKLSFTVDGISRMVIGSSFRISPGILPKKYDSWGYIITGISNSVGKQGWTTTLQTQYYPIYSNVKNDSVATQQNVIQEKSVVGNITLAKAQEMVGTLRSGEHQCANFTGRIVSLWQSGYDPKHVGANADSAMYTNFLCKHGYVVQSRYVFKNYTALGMLSAAGTYYLHNGAVIQYFTTNHDEVKGGIKHMHTCIKIGGTWYSDFKQKDPCVYSDMQRYDWTYIALLPIDRKELK